MYRADGLKVRKINQGVSATGITDYLDGFQYNKSVSENEFKIQFVPTAEGYYDFTKNSYIYNYVDHLGNVRLSYADSNKNGVIDPSTEIIEENNYYPFGLKHEGYNSLVGNPKYQYKYNGKELQETGMYDYGARFYMPDIGRWGVVDELAENFNKYSPYNYVKNTPINGFDPDGRDVIIINDSNAVGGLGHEAVIIGNEKDGWYYYSLNGTEGDKGKPYGDSSNPDIGTPLGKNLTTSQAVAVANTKNPNESHNYNRYVRIKSTKYEDDKMKEEAKKRTSVKKYILTYQDCLSVAVNTLDVLKQERAGIPPTTAKIPNIWHSELPMRLWFYNLTLFGSKYDFEYTKGTLIVGNPIPGKKEK